MRQGIFGQELNKLINNQFVNTFLPYDISSTAFVLYFVVINKKIMERLFTVLISTLFLLQAVYGQQLHIFSPNRQLEVSISTSPEITYSISYKGKKILEQGKIAMQINDGYILGDGQELINQQATSITKIIKPLVSTKFSAKRDFYKGIILTFKVSSLRTFDLEFRVFNDAVAYRFIPHFGNEILVEDELVELHFPKNTFSWYPEEKGFMSHYEPKYNFLSTDTLKPGKLASLPVLMQYDSINILFTEVNVRNYPHLFLLSGNNNSLKSSFPHMIKEVRPDPGQTDRKEKIIKTKRQISITFGERSLPWRVFLITDSDAGLMESNTLVALSDESNYKQADWIKPGKVVWDWYSANGIYKKETGKPINTETYKFYIDFAAKYGIEYVLLDEGWSKSTFQITTPNDSINMEELIAYAEERNVGILLWMLWKPLDDDMEYILKTYKKWGIKGIKVDFMQRADQDMVDFYEKVAKEAFKDSLLVDFHGAFKPAGLNIRYPNVMTMEGVRGNEYNKWSADITPEHTLVIPFTRMVAGPMDFTPGAMANVQSADFKISWDAPMSMGTKTRQTAMYVVYESALQMLCDAPQRYEKTPDVTRFISEIPVTWDETRVLKAKIGDYLIIARRKGHIWFLAAMTDERERVFNVNLSDFLSPGLYDVKIMEDGNNASTNAEDYLLYKRKIDSRKSLNIFMSQTGGYVAVFTPATNTGKKKKKKKKK